MIKTQHLAGRCLTRLLMHSVLLCLLMAWGLSVSQTAAAAVSDAQARALLEALDTRSFQAKGDAAQAIAESGAEQKTRWLQALLDGRLGKERRGERFYIITDDSGREWPIIDAITFEDAGTGTRRTVEAFKINNDLRTRIQGLLASLSLSAGDEASRLAAAGRMIGEVTADNADSVRAMRDDEESQSVRGQLDVALALYDVQQGDIDALDTLRGNLDTRVRNTLTPIAAGDSELAAEAQSVLGGIESKRAWYDRAQTLFFGLSAGSILVLAAIGLAITFGVMGVINMAHGELIMIGAYTTWMIQQALPGQPGLALALAIPGGFLVAGAFGVVIERTVIRFLKGRPLETLLATFGLSLILQQLVRSVFSPLNRRVTSPDWLQGAWQINEALSLTLNRLAVLLFCLVVFAGLWALMRYTRLGLEVRAVTQNRAMARAMGVRATRVDMLTFGLGAGVAGLAGVALSQLTNVGPNLGQGYIVDSFLVVVFGGVGNLWGTLVAGMSLGVINQVLQPWVGAVLAKIIVLVGVILFIQKRPQGIFAPKGRTS
ncbi:urea ABC transporter permease subunit UrtB [Salinicola sp. LHM]|uniref:urea ABC transporter permease subunit UrtB n=1 Tax=Salinicola sp. LHM TaxID=3065298 RepID=UPI002ACDE3E5|nr:urea ABC transporter permease subunit UrtB [Salinicola sp. LHM]MEC8918843.1 urea ABC transporter permease subunit UrtB [Pseudomonadota bacterium]WQH31887.1 urea ABC transporter permease subunit UrtB [Salinicola sp. LHM]